MESSYVTQQQGYINVMETHVDLLELPELIPLIPPYASKNLTIPLCLNELNPITENEWLYIQDSLEDLATGRYKISESTETAEELLRKLKE